MLQRLDLTNIEHKTLDSQECSRIILNKESFDRILVDAPCSGLGVMRRKPDMKYTKTRRGFNNSLQRFKTTLLESAAPLVKPGGILVYSTCTVDQKENQQVDSRVYYRSIQSLYDDTTLSERMPSEIRPYVKNGEIQILPQNFNSDGFYIACLKKKL